VAAAYRGRFGEWPAGVWAAPGRVNVIGEHVDYNGGRCLPFALPQRTFVALSPTGDDSVEVTSAQAEGGWSGALADILPGTVGPWAGYAVGVPWALREDGLPVPGFRAVVDGHVPLGAGLSSSAALECAVAVALDDLAGTGLSADDAGRSRLAAACVRAENEIAGAPTGGMDQAASLRSRAGHALLLDCRDFTGSLVPFDLAAAGLELLVMDTRAHHALVDGQYATRRRACELAAETLGVKTLGELPAAGLDDALARLPDDGQRRAVRHVVTEIDRVDRVTALLRAGSPGEVGPLLDASHTSLRDDYRVSCAELDLAVGTAREHGALGARMTGGGFGGSAIALLPAGDGDRVAAAVAEAFARAGFGPPAFLVAVPAEPARRYR
jgi:galactokinase